MMKDIVILEEKKDIKQIPPKKWDSGKITTENIGKWFYFYKNNAKSPLNKTGPFSSTSPTVGKSMGWSRFTPIITPTKITRKPNKEPDGPPFDWYDLQKARLIKEANLQKIIVCPTDVFSSSSDQKIISRSLPSHKKQLQKAHHVPQNRNIIENNMHTEKIHYHSIFPPCFGLGENDLI